MTQATTKTKVSNWIAEFDGYLLVALAAMLLRKAWLDQLPMYIHPRYTPLIMVTLVLLLLIGLMRAMQPGPSTQPLSTRLGLYGLLLTPILLGLLLPATPAGSSLVDPRQLNTVGVVYGSQTKLDTTNTATWNLFDWTMARYNLTRDQAHGKPVDVVGFVYHAPDQAPNEFSVLRYVLACCVADRRGLGLTVKSEQAQTLSTDQWVRVTGKIEVIVTDQLPEYVITDAVIEPVGRPSNPYLYAN